MKKVFLAAALATQLTTQLFARGDITPVEVHEAAVMEHHEAEPVHGHHEESKFYIVIAGMMLVGDEIQHGDAVLDGNNDYGYGYGIDVGYRLGHGFAFEYDFTYGRNTVHEITAHEEIEVEAKYYTSALDIVYTYEATEHLGIFGKMGYEVEWETIAELGIEDEKEEGVVYGVGIEYALNKHYKLLAEYEHSTIEGPHGDSILAGIMFNF